MVVCVLLKMKATFPINPAASSVNSQYTVTCSTFKKEQSNVVTNRWNATHTHAHTHSHTTNDVIHWQTSDEATANSSQCTIMFHYCSPKTIICVCQRVIKTWGWPRWRDATSGWHQATTINQAFQPTPYQLHIKIYASASKNTLFKIW